MSIFLRIAGALASGSAFNTVSPGTPAVFESAATYYISVAMLTSTKAIVAYRDNGNLGRGTACILDISGSAITPATPAVFETGDTDRISVAALSATQAIVVYRDNGNSEYGTACILDVSTSTISPGTPAVFESAATTYCNVAALSSSAAIATYTDNTAGGYGTACILSVSGSTITPQTPAVYNSAGSNFNYVAALSSSKAIVCYQDDGDAGQGKACILDVSGTTITPATPAIFSSAANYTSVQALSATKAIVAYRGDSAKGQACVLDIATSTITPGTPVDFAAGAAYTSVSVLSATKAITAYSGGSSYGVACVLDVSISTVVPGSEATYESAIVNYTSVVTLTSIKAIVAYTDVGNSNYGTACILDII